MSDLERVKAILRKVREIEWIFVSIRWVFVNASPNFYKSVLPDGAFSSRERAKVRVALLFQIRENVSNPPVGA